MIDFPIVDTHLSFAVGLPRFDTSVHMPTPDR